MGALAGDVCAVVPGVYGGMGIRDALTWAASRRKGRFRQELYHLVSLQVAQKLLEQRV